MLFYCLTHTLYQGFSFHFIEGNFTHNRMFFQEYKSASKKSRESGEKLLESSACRRYVSIISYILSYSLFDEHFGGESNEFLGKCHKLHSKNNFALLTTKINYLRTRVKNLFV